MFHSWSARNKLVSKALQVQWTSDSVGYNGYTASTIYEYHRLATKSYEYFGMDEATARACQDAMLAKYTRTFTQWYTSSGAARLTRKMTCVATVDMNYDEADLWTVSVDVSEDQVQYVPRYLPDPAESGLFDLSLDYDEDPLDGACLQITSCTRKNSQLTIAYAHYMADFSSANVHAEHSTDGGVTWASAAPSSVTSSAVVFNSGAWTPGLYRLRYGSGPVLSNWAQTPPGEPTETLVLGTPYYQFNDWRFQVMADFGGFDITEMLVEYRASGTAAWQDITAACSFQSDRVNTPFTDRAAKGYFRCTYQGVTSDPVAIPYDPSTDTGDGSIVVLGVSGMGVNTAWRFTVDTSGLTELSTDLITAKTSTDGMTWTDVSLAYKTLQNGSSVAALDLTATITATTYVKIYYDGVQATNAMQLPYAAPAETAGKVWHIGFANTASPALKTSLYFAYGAGVDPGNAVLEVSTDGGETWAALAGTAYDGRFDLATPIMDTTARLFRFNGDAMSDNLALPIA